MRNPYLAPLGRDGIRRLRTLSQQGKQRLADIDAAVRRAERAIPTPSQLPREAELSLRLYTAEMWNGKTFTKARQWVERVDDYATGYDVLEPITQVPNAPDHDLSTMIDVSAAHSINAFLAGFRHAVSGRYQVIDALLNGTPPTAQTVSAPPVPLPTPPPSSPAPPDPITHIKDPATGISATIIKVLVASPGDITKERSIVEEVIKEWNSDHAQNLKVILLAQMWEVDTYPRMGGGAQAQVNIQIADRADIVIALFRGRLGQPTRNYPSGTAEEIERAMLRNVPVHIYTSKQLPADVDLGELARLRAYLDNIREQGLIGSYRSGRDLRKKVRKALENDIADFLKGQSD